MAGIYLTDDWLLVPALNVVPLDPVLVEVVQDPNATLVLPALLCLPDQIKRLDVKIKMELNFIFFCQFCKLKYKGVLPVVRLGLLEAT